MNLSNVKRGELYNHRVLGKCRLIASHPEDGALLIVESVQDDDDFTGEYCETEACYLTEIK